jgi:hypothetical protein
VLGRGDAFEDGREWLGIFVVGGEFGGKGVFGFAVHHFEGEI